MSLKERLMNDLKEAMREKNQLRKSVITMVRAAIKQIEVDNRIELNDEAIIEIMSKQVKQKRDAIEEFARGGREDLVNQTKEEIDVLMEYLPKQLSEEEIRQIVSQVIDEVEASSTKDIGKVMSVLMPKIRNKADGKLVNKIVKQLLQ